ncbi:nuclear transport factor 2 family protein [Ideonella sp. 4Y11]|uniref:Nuclear transport factor 2 family protein n=1 Tax=Ideonella aquatica TaxID=2824119 RepID=A0A941BR96_9BURK|nr:nuclear transport factor 2 family protein [Ideonella aquatica]MBQ0960105.1 nuclear transport factor 2 family protein [Ideonella aquatica]
MSPLDDLVMFYEQLQPADLARLPQLYAADARFKDPFNEVQGIAAIEAVFEHMFRRLQGPRFVVTERVDGGEQAFLTWDFLFTLPGEHTERRIRGATHLRFDAEGRVTLHRDYWDAAEELYEQLPLLGALMRWLKRRARRG